MSHDHTAWVTEQDPVSKKKKKERKKKKQIMMREGVYIKMIYEQRSE